MELRILKARSSKLELGVQVRGYRAVLVQGLGLQGLEFDG